jgi:hypothetical protein
MTKIISQAFGPARLNRAFSRFKAAEDGFLSIQVLFFFFIMLLVGGVAVDVMRFETRRVAVQQTMDRATLAAASLEQTLIPQAVVYDYFQKGDVGEELDSVTVVDSANSRMVSARATVRSYNYFMSLMDIPYLEAQSRSRAQQSISDIEIIMVLDVSGSMEGAKLTNLKSAASDFVDTVFENDVMGRISIGIVPYNAQVNIGQPLRDRFNITYQHGRPNANCVELPSAAFSTLALSQTTGYPQMALADVNSSTTTSAGSYGNGAWISPTNTNAIPVNSAATQWCNASTVNDVVLPTKNRTALKNAINALDADGNTSILLGMRWATALLDPSMRDDYNALIGSGDMTGDMAGRPYDYNNNEAMKVVILMTDGKHVAHDRIDDAYKTAQSPIWRSTGDGNYSVYHDRPSTTADYWVPHRSSGAGEWMTAPWNSGSGTTRLNWNQVWERQRMNWVAFQLFARPLGGTSSSARSTHYNTWRSNFLEQYMSVSTMDSRLSVNCTAARTQGVLVYGIAFEAPPEGVAAISDCASKPASTYFFDANGLEIATAFQLIAASLSQLKLTQ